MQPNGSALRQTNRYRSPGASPSQAGTNGVPPRKAAVFIQPRNTTPQQLAEEDIIDNAAPGFLSSNPAGNGERVPLERAPVRGLGLNLGWQGAPPKQAAVQPAVGPACRPAPAVRAAVGPARELEGAQYGTLGGAATLPFPPAAGTGAAAGTAHCAPQRGVVIPPAPQKRRGLPEQQQPEQEPPVRMPASAPVPAPVQQAEPAARRVFSRSKSRSRLQFRAAVSAVIAARQLQQKEQRSAGRPLAPTPAPVAAAAVSAVSARPNSIPQPQIAMDRGIDMSDSEGDDDGGFGAANGADDLDSSSFMYDDFTSNAGELSPPQALQQPGTSRANARPLVTDAPLQPTFASPKVIPTPIAPLAVPTAAPASAARPAPLFSLADLGIDDGPEYPSAQAEAAANVNQRAPAVTATTPAVQARVPPPMPTPVQRAAQATERTPAPGPILAQTPSRRVPPSTQQQQRMRAGSDSSIVATGDAASVAVLEEDLGTHPSVGRVPVYGMSSAELNPEGTATLVLKASQMRSPVGIMSPSATARGTGTSNTSKAAVASVAMEMASGLASPIPTLTSPSANAAYHSRTPAMQAVNPVSSPAPSRNAPEANMKAFSPHTRRQPNIPASNEVSLAHAAVSLPGAQENVLVAVAPVEASAGAFTTRMRRPYRPSNALNEDEYDFAVIVRAVETPKQIAALARAKAQADAIAAANARFTKLLHVQVNPEDHMEIPPHADSESDVDDDSENDDEERAAGLGSRTSSFYAKRDMRAEVLREKQRHSHEGMGDSASESDSDDMSDSTVGSGDDYSAMASSAHSGQSRRKRRSILDTIADATESGVRRVRNSIGAIRNKYEQRRARSKRPHDDDESSLGSGNQRRERFQAKHTPRHVHFGASENSRSTPRKGKHEATETALDISSRSVMSELAAEVDEKDRDVFGGARIHKCAEILAALRAAGLQAKRVRSLSRRTWLIKILAPEWRLELEAERVKLRMRRKDGGWSRFRRAMRDAFLPSIPEDAVIVDRNGEEIVIGNGSGHPEADSDDGTGIFGSLTGVEDDHQFSRGKAAVGRQENSATARPAGSATSMFSIFHSSDRQHLINHILRSSSREGGADLGDDTPLGAYVEHIFPLHMAARLQELRSDWLTVWRPERSWDVMDRIGEVKKEWYSAPALLSVSAPTSDNLREGFIPESSNDSNHGMMPVQKPSDDGDRRGAARSGGNLGGSGDDPSRPPRHNANSHANAAEKTIAMKRKIYAEQGEPSCMEQHPHLCGPCLCIGHSLGRCGRSTRRLCNGLLSQPLDRIAAYFGETTAFYFGWLEFYTRWLLLPAVAGVLLFLAQMYHGTLDVPYVPLFSLFMAVWSILFLEFWKRRNAELAQRWGVLNYEDEEVVRPQFYGEWKQDASNGELVRVYPRWKRVLKFTITVPVIFGFLVGMVALMIIVFSTRDRLLAQVDVFESQYAIRSAFIANATSTGGMTLQEALQLAPPAPSLSLNVQASLSDAWEGGIVGFVAFTSEAEATMQTSATPSASTDVSTSSPRSAFQKKLARIESFFSDQHDWRWWLVMTLPPIVYGCMMPIFDFVFGRLALWFNKWENHATESRYRNHRIAKVFIHRFVSCFVSLFYYAFAPGHSLMSLFVQLAAFLIVGQLWNNFIEVATGCLRRRWKEWRFRRLVRNAEESGLTEGRRGRRLLRHASSDAWKQSRLPVYDTFNDYAELLIQYGYVTFFSWAFPLAPLCALFNNIIEMRTDAYKLCSSTQRPIAHKAGGIGVWYNVLVSMSLLALLTNCAHLALSSQQFKALLPGLTDSGRLLLVFLFEHLVLALRFIMVYMIPPVSAAVKRRMQRDAMLLAKLQGRKSVGL